MALGSTRRRPRPEEEAQEDADETGDEAIVGP